MADFVSHYRLHEKKTLDSAIYSQKFTKITALIEYRLINIDSCIDENDDDEEIVHISRPKFILNKLDQSTYIDTKRNQL